MCLQSLIPKRLLKLMICVGCIVFSFALVATESRPFLFPLNGMYNHAISSKSSLAQDYFNQGMIFFYGYNYGEAARSFQEAAKLDPNCAICFWGAALALRGNLDASKGRLPPEAIESMKKAKSLILQASPQEQAYIEAFLNSYLLNRTTLKDSDQAFIKEMKNVIEKYPEDLDATTLHAKVQMDTIPPNEWGDVRKELLKVLAKDPNHPGANHYYIHAVETTNPQDGVASAKKLENLFPFTGHLLHMPAHIYFKLGDFHKATLANEKAIKADEDLFAKGGVKGEYFSTYYMHNLQFLIATLVMEGKKQEALQAAQKISEILKENPPLSVYMQNALAAQRILILQRFNLEGMIGRGEGQKPDPGALDEIFQEAKPGTPLGNGMWHYARSMAYLAKNDLQNAKIEAEAIQQEHVDESEDKLNTLLRIVFLNASAAIKEQEGDQKGMIQNYEEAITLENEIAHFEPPLWFISSKEALGFAYLRMGMPQEAKKMFQEDLQKHLNKMWIPRSERQK